MWKPNRLDRWIAYLSPQRAARRLAARAYGGMLEQLGGSYLGARRDRRQTREWTPWPGEADEEILGDLAMLRARSRDMARNEPLASGAIDTVVMNTAGSGLSLLAQPDWEFLGLTELQAEQWKQDVQREFRFWSESQDCDAARTLNFYALQALVLRSWLESGDTFTVLTQIERPAMPYGLALQVIEADRVCTPPDRRADDAVRGGVEVDPATGAPLSYFIARQHPGATRGLLGARMLEFDRYPAFGARTGRRNVLHQYIKNRPGQSRGVPFLAPVIEPLKMLGRYTQATLDRAVIQAMLAAFVKTDIGTGFPVEPAVAGQPASAPPLTKLESMTITELRPGEDVSFLKSETPNPEFDAFVQSLAREIGVALGLPFEVLIKHFTASYSAARAALLEAWKFFRYRRELLAAQFCQPVYEAWLDEAIAIGRVRAPGFLDDPLLRAAWSAAEWQGDAMPQIDPVKEVDAAKTRIEIGVSSRTRETLALSGAEFADVHRDLVREQQMRQRDGIGAPSAAMPGAASQAQPGQPDPDAPEEDA